MVSNPTVQENGAGTTPRLPPGKYKIVGFDLDLTGRRLIDEICHIGAYTPNSQFSQYVMPFKDPNFVSSYRHMLRVATVGRYRMLKCLKTGEVLKTKSEISALADFIQWLENFNAEGIILLTHDSNKTVPPFLLEVLRKYKLFDRFTAVVKGFANSVTLAQQRCDKPVKSYSLYVLTTALLGKAKEIHSAADRARLSYQIVQSLCPGEGGEGDRGSGDATSTTEVDNPAMSEALRQIATTIADEEKELAELKELVERQNGLRPIFGDMISSCYKAERNRATTLRRMLAVANLTYENLLGTWRQDGKNSLLALLTERVTDAKKEDIDDVLDLMLCHFDVDNSNKMHQRRGQRAAKTQSEGSGEPGKEVKGDKSQEAGDKGSKAPSGKSPGKEDAAASSPAKPSGEKTDEDSSR